MLENQNQLYHLNLLNSGTFESQFFSLKAVTRWQKLPKLLAIKTILKPSYSEYNNITPIENKTIKPKKPSQEELLDDVLESILE